MLRANLPQPLQVPLRRHQHARRPRHRLDDHRRDGRGIVQRHEPLQLVRQLRPVLRLALRERVPRRQMRVRQVIHPGQQRAEELAVAHDPADGNAAEIHPVIAALAPDQPGPRPLPDRPLVGDGDLQRRLHRLRAGVGEERVLHSLRRDVHQPVGQLERLRMAHLEGRRIVHLRRLALDRRGDPRPAVPGIAAPEARRPVQHPPPVRGGVMHALRGHEHARRLLELPIGRERHPERPQIVGGDARTGGHGGVPRVWTGTLPPATRGSSGFGRARIYLQRGSRHRIRAIRGILRKVEGHLRGILAMHIGGMRNAHAAAAATHARLNSDPRVTRQPAPRRPRPGRRLSALPRSALVATQSRPEPRGAPRRRRARPLASPRHRRRARLRRGQRLSSGPAGRSLGLSPGPRRDLTSDARVPTNPED